VHPLAWLSCTLESWILYRCSFVFDFIFVLIKWWWWWWCFSFRPILFAEPSMSRPFLKPLDFRLSLLSQASEHLPHLLHPSVIVVWCQSSSAAQALWLTLRLGLPRASRYRLVTASSAWLAIWPLIWTIGTTIVSVKEFKLDGQGRARREAARRRNSECKMNLSSRNSSLGNGTRPTASADWLAVRCGAATNVLRRRPITAAL